MYSGLQQQSVPAATCKKQGVRTTALQVAFLNNNRQPDTQPLHTVFLSSSGYYYVDGVSVQADLDEESQLYHTADYEWTDTWY